MYTLNLLAVLLLGNFLPRWTVLLLFPLTIFFFVETFQFTYNSLAELYIKISQYYAHFLNYFFSFGSLSFAAWNHTWAQLGDTATIFFVNSVLSELQINGINKNSTWGFAPKAGHQQITANPRAIFILMCSAYDFWLTRAHIRSMLWCDSRGSDLGRRSRHSLAEYFQNFLRFPALSHSQFSFMLFFFYSFCFAARIYFHFVSRRSVRYNVNHTTGRQLT